MAYIKQYLFSVSGGKSAVFAFLSSACHVNGAFCWTPVCGSW